MVVKLIAAVLFTVCGAFAGIVYSEKLKTRTEVCAEIKRVLHICETNIRCRAEDVYGIVRRLRAEKLRYMGFLSRIPDTYAPESDFRRDWLNALEAERALPAEEKRLLSELGSVLGRGDISSQLEEVSALLVLTGDLALRRREEYAGKGRLYRTIGLLTGIMTGIIVV